MRLRRAIAACRRGFTGVALFSLCINLLVLATPLFMFQVYDRVLTSRSVDTLLLLIIAVMGALVAFALLDMLRGRVLAQIGAWLDRTLGREVLAATVVRAVVSTQNRSAQGLRDLATFRNFLAGPTVFPLMDSPWTPIFVALIFILHPFLGIIAGGGAVALFLFALLNDAATRGRLQRASQAQIGALHRAEEAARNADVIEAMGMMPALVARWTRETGHALALQTEASTRGGAITSISRFTRLSLQVGIMGAGAWLVIRGELTPGGMIAGSILMSRALAPVEQAIAAWRTGISALAAYRRLRTVLDRAPERGNAMPLPAPAGRLSVEGVVFAHPGTTEPVIRGVSFALEPGEVLALIGPTAAGKTTLARMLVGNLKPLRGHVRLDEMDIAVWEPEDRGRHVGYLPQDIELFSGTVRENIARLAEGESELVVKAAKLAGVHEMILRLPKGYDTEIGEAGASISGGQRQRIALARALYGAPRLVVLDEPNANLDGEGELALMNAIADLRRRKVTVLLVAHRPSLVRQVDRILVLQQGRVQAFGPRDEILARITRPEPAPGVVRTGGSLGGAGA